VYLHLAAYRPRQRALMWARSQPRDDVGSRLRDMTADYSPAQERECGLVVDCSSFNGNADRLKSWLPRVAGSLRIAHETDFSELIHEVRHLCGDLAPQPVLTAPASMATPIA
jgi:hypothetical protein